MNPSERITTEPGKKFQGDRVILFEGVWISMREQGELARRVAHNEALRKKRDGMVSYWRRDPYEYFAGFLHDSVLARTWADFEEVCRRYGL